jgi:hypothetical protein
VVASVSADDGDLSLTSLTPGRPVRNCHRFLSFTSDRFQCCDDLAFFGGLAWKNIGLPQSHLPLALLSFNVGVEFGQLLMVLLAYGIVHLPIPRRWLGTARRPALYAIGIVAAYWSWLRIAAIVS